MLYTKLVLMALFWSGVFPAINIVLSSMGLFISVFLRFWFAAVILLILLRLREPRLPDRADQSGLHRVLRGAVPQGAARRGARGGHRAVRARRALGSDQGKS